MTALYNGRVTNANPLPHLWLLSDARNDAVLEQALAKLPRGNGFVFRHYHLPDAVRRRRFDHLAAVAHNAGHLVILSDAPTLAQAWGADGIYGPAQNLGKHCGMIRLATAHDASEIALANAAGADGVFLSPVFPTRSHPGGQCLGAQQFLSVAAQAQMPVIALGGMTEERAHALDWPRWAAIDGLA